MARRVYADMCVVVNVGLMNDKAVMLLLYCLDGDAVVGDGGRQRREETMFGDRDDAGHEETESVIDLSRPIVNYEPPSIL